MFGFFESDEHKKVKTHLANLAALAKVDGHVDSTEMNFIVQIGQKQGLKAEDVKSLIASASSMKFELPKTDSDRFDQIFDLVEMMLADGVVDDNEMDFCIDMATRLGFRKAIVGVLVRKITMGVKDGLTRESIKKDSQAFLDFK
jgi:uncharacterized tellurite resistance protein B-like protein